MRSMSESLTLRTVWLVRHGNRLDFVDPTWPDTAEEPHDCPLSPDGVIQAQETGRRLAREPIDHVVASPFRRATETAGHIAEALGLPVKIEHGLCEMLLSKWFPVQPLLRSPEQLVGDYPRIDCGYRPSVSPLYPETEDDVTDRGRDAVHALLT